MYQSIPKRVYTTQESAMPKMPAQTLYSGESRDREKVSALTQTSKQSSLFKSVKNLQTDDLLLIGLLLLLISEDGDHQLLIAVVAFLLFS